MSEIDEYYFKRCLEVAEKATCPRRKVGAVIVSFDGREISTGYNGAPSGEAHCVDAGCIIGTCFDKCEILHDGGHCQRAVHAEVNAIALAAKAGRSTSGCTMYTTITACPTCVRVAKNAGISVFKSLTDEPKYYNIETGEKHG